MLMQAQSQKERDFGEKKGEDVAGNGEKVQNFVDDAKEVKAEPEDFPDDDNGESLPKKPRFDDNSANNEDVDMKDVENCEDRPVKDESKDLKDISDDASKDINIDPRTYCKLGHFHLLLEQYPKGEIFRSLQKG